MNKGERAELKFIATLGCFLGKSINIGGNPNNIITVSSVAIPERSADQLITIKQPLAQVTPNTIYSMTDTELLNHCKAVGIKKAGPFSKADVFINKVGYSVKCTDGGLPALVNHTNRIGWEFVANQTGANINLLDQLIAEYWNKRIAGKINEDIPNSDIQSPFSNHIETLRPYLNYFCFDGTGNKISSHKAQKIIEFSNPCDARTWKVYDKTNYLDAVWLNLVFSLRSKKGMPTNINRLNLVEKNSIMQWSKDFQGSLRGALHVRFR